MIAQLLLWLAGADRDLLGKCQRLPQSERQRLMALGGTVLIPAVQGFAAGGYAAFTFIHSPQIAFAFGAIWAIVVLWLDRLLVMSFHKSRIEPPLSFWGAAIARLLFSCIIAYGLAEPLTLLMFNGPIMQQMADDVRAREEGAFRNAEALRANAYTALAKERTQATKDLTDQLAAETNRYNCLSSLVSLEMTGGVMRGTPVKGPDGAVCGYVTGEASCGPECKADMDAQNRLATDMRRIQQQLQSRLEVIDTSNIGAAGEEAKRIQQQVVAEKPPTDFATRRRALSEIEAKDPVTRGVHAFVIIGLMLLDSLTLLIKTLVPSGEYEEVRDTALAVARATARAERAAAVEWIATHGQAIQQEYLSHEASKRQIVAVSQAVRALAEELTREFRLFHAQLEVLAHMVAQLKDAEARATCMKLLTNLQQTFNDALEEALERFRADL